MIHADVLFSVSKITTQTLDADKFAPFPCPG